MPGLRQGEANFRRDVERHALDVQRSINDCILRLDNLGTISVKDYGAKGDGVTDDTVALQAAADAALEGGFRLVSVPGTYLVSDTWTVNCHGDLSTMTVTPTSASVSPVVRVGSLTGTTFPEIVRGINLVLPLVVNAFKPATGWSGIESQIGVEMANLYESVITVPGVDEFGIGLSCGGYTSGFVYNVITLQRLYNNKVNLRLQPGATTGWSNQNQFIGGRLSHSSSEGSVVTGVRHIKLSNPVGAVHNPPNNNLFLNTSVEGGVCEYSLDIQGYVNTFIGPRFEQSGRIRFYSLTASQTQANVILGGYDFGLTYTFDGESSPWNQRIGGRLNNAMESTGCLWSLGNSSSSTETAPHIQGFAAGTRPLGKGAADTDWQYRLYAGGMSLKGASDNEARLRLTSNGAVYFGSGTAAPTEFLIGSGGSILSGGVLAPYTTDTYTLGTASRLWSTIYGTNVYAKRVTGIGTTHNDTDYALSSGWGDTATVSGVAAKDTGGRITVTCGGSGIATNPTVTLTFVDGAWSSAPAVVATGGGVASAADGRWLVTSVSTTAVVFTFYGTPLTGVGYAFNFIAMGR